MHMADSEKAKLYREIVQQTPEQVLAERMRLYGFWPERQPLPKDPPEEAAERERIQKAMAQLRKGSSVVKNPEKALAVERKRRWEESKKRRAENKAKREEERKERRAAYDAFRKDNVVHVGAGYSAGLQNATGAIL